MIEFLLAGLAIAIALPTVFFSVQLLLAETEPADLQLDDRANLSGFGLLIPAHDEATVIGATLEPLIAAVSNPRQVLVVADNCSDDTAGIARQLGVEVIERKDESKRGKGYALDYGISHLQSRSPRPAVVIVVDADCRVEPGALAALTNLCSRSGRPVQALYLMKNQGSASVRQKIAEFAWVIKNRARPLGLRRLGLPCQLMGSGMAFTTGLLEKLDLGSGHLVEDMKLGVDCARLGYPPVFCPSAVFVSYFPGELASLQSQRTRWEHGHLSMMVTGAYDLLKAAFVRKDGNCLGMALDLAIPPLAFLVLLLSVLTVLSASAVWLFHSGYVALWILLSAILFLGASILLAWYRFARDIITPGELLWVPVYILTKIPMYARYWFRRQVEWVRTKRD